MPESPESVPPKEAPKEEPVAEMDAAAADDSVRPGSLDDFIGQNELRANLRVYLGAAKERGRALDHVLFCGNPGLGKTTLAQIMAVELGVNFVSTSGPVLERAGDLAAILTNLGRHDILFVDEIHRMPIVVEEVLYPAMEDFKLDLVVGQGPAARTVKIDLDPFTLVGATTRMGLISSPLRDRFGIVAHLEFYSAEDLARVVRRTATILRVELRPEAAIEIGRRARGTPRIANRLLRRVRDFAVMHGDGTVTGELASAALTRMGVDDSGLDQMDRKLLKALVNNFGGGPVGVKTLAVACSEEVRTIEDIYEPFLIQSGFIKRTSRGRMATPKAFKHVGERPPTDWLTMAEAAAGRGRSEPSDEQDAPEGTEGSEQERNDS
jgi:Holliday junction DNA helicase RuvB